MIAHDTKVNESVSRISILAKSLKESAFPQFHTISHRENLPPGPFTRDYLRDRGMAPAKVGNADSYLLDAADLADHGAHWMERTFAGKPATP